MRCSYAISAVKALPPAACCKQFESLQCPTANGSAGDLFSGGKAPAPAPAAPVSLGPGLSAAPTAGGAPGTPQGTGMPLSP